MSAICGIINFDGKPVEKSELVTMVESSPYRGPDGASFHLDEAAGFAQLAFHTTPESVHERQPLISNDGQLVLLADVRLDNRGELVKKLEISPDPNRIITDPDLIMLSYQKWGADCVAHFLGDFVFSIWDRRSKSLFLARDPLGGYCVHYHQAGQAFIFASEISAILDLPCVGVRINEDRVLRELELVPRSHEETFFESVYYLAPAHCLQISAAGKKTWKYWDIDPDHRISCTDDDEYSEQLLELVDQAVASRMRSIGPVGISLSGGNDSTLLAASAARHLKFNSAHEATFKQPQLSSFSYVFSHHDECDEMEYIVPVIEQYRLDAHFVEADELWTFSNLRDQAIARDYFWSNCFVQLPESIARAAQAAACKVLIDGQFGDALFSGANIVLADLLRQRQFGRAARYLRRYSDHGQLGHELFHKGIRPLVPGRIRRVWQAMRPARKLAFNAGLRPERLARAKELRRQAAAHKKLPGLEPGRQSRYNSLFSAIWPQGRAAIRGLTYGRFGIESVSPYFDRRIVEFIMALPNERINAPDRHRLLQNQAMQKRLPHNVCSRTRKTEFSTLLKTGLFEKEKPVVKELLENSRAVDQGWFDADWIRQQMTEANTSDSNTHQLSMYLHLELWLRSVTEATGHRRKWSVPWYYSE